MSSDQRESLSRSAVLSRLPDTTMQNGMDGYMNGTMGGYGLWPWLGALLAVFLIVAIVKMVRQK